MEAGRSTEHAAEVRPLERHHEGDGEREVVSRFYDNFDRGDIEAALAVFSDDLETTDPGMGTVHGLAPFRERPLVERGRLRVGAAAADGGDAEEQNHAGMQPGAGQAAAALEKDHD